jgi:hypothetical protein
VTWEWVIVVLGLALVYAALFIVALLVIAKVSVAWARGLEAPAYEPGDFSSGDTLVDPTAEWPKQ